MPFKSLLGRLVDGVPGARGAILVDWEGEAVDYVARMDDYDLRILGAHNGLILDRLRAAVDRLEGAGLEEIVITTSASQTLVMPVSPEYFVVLTLGRSDALGRARFELRRCAGQLSREVG